jgi:hypothetical protein
MRTVIRKVRHLLINGKQNESFKTIKALSTAPYSVSAIIHLRKQSALAVRNQWCRKNWRMHYRVSMEKHQCLCVDIFCHSIRIVWVHFLALLCLGSCFEVWNDTITPWARFATYAAEAATHDNGQKTRQVHFTDGGRTAADAAAFFLWITLWLYIMLLHGVDDVTGVASNMNLTQWNLNI